MSLRAVYASFQVADPSPPRDLDAELSVVPLPGSSPPPKMSQLWDRMQQSHSRRPLSIVLDGSGEAPTRRAASSAADNAK